MTWRLRPSDHPVWRAKSLFYQLCRGSSYRLTGTVIVSLACHRLRSITTVFARHQLLYYDVHCCPPKYIYSPLKYTYNPPKYTEVHWSTSEYTFIKTLFPSFLVARVISGIFFCEVTVSPAIFKSCLMNNLPFPQKRVFFMSDLAFLHWPHFWKQKNLPNHLAVRLQS